MSSKVQIIINSQTRALTKAIPRESGTNLGFRATWMLRLHGPMPRLTFLRYVTWLAPTTPAALVSIYIMRRWSEISESCREHSTGDSLLRRWTLDTQRILLMDSKGSLRILMPFSYGAEMERFISSKGTSTTDLIQPGDLPWQPGILSPLVTGRVSQIVLMPPYSTPMETHTSSRWENGSLLNSTISCVIFRMLVSINISLQDNNYWRFNDRNFAVSSLST